MKNKHNKLYIVVKAWFDEYTIHGIFNDKEMAKSALKSLQIIAKKRYEHAVKQNEEDNKKDGYNITLHPYENHYKIAECNLNTFYRRHLRD